MSKGRYKSEEQKSELKNMKWLHESLEAVTKVFNGHFSILSEAKCKIIHEKRIQSMPASVARIAKVSEHLNLKYKDYQ